MKLAGFNFTKISAEKFSDALEKLKINTNIDISDIFELKSDFLKTKEELLGVKFSYVVDYEPKVAKTEINGTMILVLEPKVIKEILKKWKDKKIPEDFRIPVFNIILRKSSLKALQLEEEMNLPLHIPSPSFKKEEKK